MKFCIINATDHIVTIEDCSNFDDALSRAGLKKNEIDFGQVRKGLCIVVYEYGLFEIGSNYFELGGQLYAGSALLFSVDHLGATIDIVEADVPKPMFFGNSTHVEAAIKAGLVIRPQTSVNGRLI